MLTLVIAISLGLSTTLAVVFASTFNCCCSFLKPLPPPPPPSPSPISTAGTFCIYAADLVATNGACSACTLPADPASTSATDASPATASGTAAAALPTRATAAATAARPAGTDTAPSPAGAADTAPSPTAPATVGWSSAFGIS